MNVKLLTSILLFGIAVRANFSLAEEPFTLNFRDVVETVKDSSGNTVEFRVKSASQVIYQKGYEFQGLMWQRASAGAADAGRSAWVVKPYFLHQLVDTEGIYVFKGEPTFLKGPSFLKSGDIDPRDAEKIKEASKRLMDSVRSYGPARYAAAVQNSNAKFSVQLVKDSFQLWKTIGIFSLEASPAGLTQTGTGMAARFVSKAPTLAVRSIAGLGFGLVYTLAWNSPVYAGEYVIPAMIPEVTAALTSAACDVESNSNINDSPDCVELRPRLSAHARFTSNDTQNYLKQLDQYQCRISCVDCVNKVRDVMGFLMRTNSVVACKSPSTPAAKKVCDQYSNELKFFLNRCATRALGGVFKTVGAPTAEERENYKKYFKLYSSDDPSHFWNPPAGSDPLRPTEAGKYEPYNFETNVVPICNLKLQD